MSSFREDDLAGPDWPLFQNGWVTLYWKLDILESDCKALLDRGYRLHRLVTDTWRSEADALGSLGEALAFPDYYGRNLDAFRDCLSDIEAPNDTGAAIVLLRYDRFVAIEPKPAQQLLDIMADRARDHMLFGRRLAILVQTDDPRLSFGPLAPTHAGWNRREWLNRNRGL